MEKPPAVHTVHVGSQHSTAPHGPGATGIPADDGGNDVDQPPIPSAGSSIRESVLMNDKILDAARDTKATNSISTVEEPDSSHTLHNRAHTLTQATVAAALGANLE